jgi:hypothetical protein
MSKLGYRCGADAGKHFEDMMPKLFRAPNRQNRKSRPTKAASGDREK